MGRKYRFYQSRLANQILTSFCLLLLLAGSMSLGLTYYLHQENLKQEIQSKAASITRSLQIAARTTIRSERPEELKQVVLEYGSLPGVLEVLILDSAGNTIATTDHQEENRPYEEVHPEVKVAISEARRTNTEVYQNVILHNEPVLLYILPLSIESSPHTNAPTMAISVLDLKLMQQESSQSFFIATTSMLSITLGVLAVMALVLRKTILQPLSQLTHQVASSKDSGDFVLSNALPNNEIRWLAETFNQVFQERYQAEQTLQYRALWLRNQGAILSRLARQRDVSAGNLQAAAQEMTKAIAETLMADRASIWLYNDSKTHLNCIDLFEHNLLQSTSEQHTSDLSLVVEQYPIYFHTLETAEEPIVASDACTDPRTYEFASTYLVPLDIQSMLDVPIRVSGQTVGVLCIEQVGKMRYWTPEDESFARSIGDLVALSVEARDRKLAEQALKHSEMRNQALVNAQPDLLIRMKADGTYIDVVRGGIVQLLRPERMRPGISIYEMLPLEQAQQRMYYVQLALETKNIQVYEYNFEIDNQNYIEEARIIACGDNEVLVIVRDITERKQTEKLLIQQAEDLENALRELQRTQSQIIQSEKMSSLGQMVAGVAHEINNPVNFIYGNINLAHDDSDALLDLLKLYQRYYPNPVPEIQRMIEEIDLEFIEEDLPKMLSSMRIGAERIREIVRSLRTFSRLDEAEYKIANVHDGIDSTLMILQHRLKAQPNQPEIRIVKEYTNLPEIECYPGQLNQVLMNILSNAIDALEDHVSHEHYVENELGNFAACPFTAPPTITIRTQKISATHIAIHLADNGPGISQEVHSKLFDPFFTTKPVGKGTGLGLSISYQIIVQKHGGKLSCHSTPGQGTEFVIELPIQIQSCSSLLKHSSRKAPQIVAM